MHCNCMQCACARARTVCVCVRAHQGACVLASESVSDFCQVSGVSADAGQKLKKLELQLSQAAHASAAFSTAPNPPCERYNTTLLFLFFPHCDLALYALSLHSLIGENAVHDDAVSGKTTWGIAEQDDVFAAANLVVVGRALERHRALVHDMNGLVLESYELARRIERHPVGHNIDTYFGPCQCCVFTPQPALKNNQSLMVWPCAS